METVNKKLFEELLDDFHKLHIHNIKQAERIKALEQLLIEYGRHSSGCSAPYGYDCRCGWDREKKILEG